MQLLLSEQPLRPRRPSCANVSPWCRQFVTTWVDAILGKCSTRGSSSWTTCLPRGSLLRWALNCLAGSCVLSYSLCLPASRTFLGFLWLYLRWDHHLWPRRCHDYLSARLRLLGEVLMVPSAEALALKAPALVQQIRCQPRPFRVSHGRCFD